eukprot:TRINITY_DN14322_c0_g2_i2.p2 TRINITY_DN14322_c0_g2~~TRINITY_DN14322_c0_g2_i2.p2  ORF type:complete len:203 (-),score=5.16 TRINITY_DN14322_c0_g2_i2:353-925(-)
MAIYYTIAIILLQFYTGTVRYQLEEKGDHDHFYTDLTGPMQALGFIGVPIIGWLLDDVGFGVTFLVVLLLIIIDVWFQMIPNLQVQWVTLIVWSVSRFALNSSYYSVMGSIFGFTHFGKLVGVKSFFTALFSFLQYPLLLLVVYQFGGDFLYIHIFEIVILSCLIPFCVRMIRETQVVRAQNKDNNQFIV